MNASFRPITNAQSQTWQVGGWLPFMIITLSFLLTGCGRSGETYDAYGVFETTEIIVSAEVSGTLLALDAQEGDPVNAGAIIGHLDSTQLLLKKRQLEATLRGLKQRRPDTNKQLAVLQEQLRTVNQEVKRLENLVKANAATSKQLDDLKAQKAVLERQLTATRSTLETTVGGLSEDETALSLQIEQLADQLSKCQLKSPIDGTLLVKYCEKGELAAPGKPLFKVADTNHFFLRAYVTADQLAALTLGQNVTVHADYGKETKDYQGTINWIATTAEFTPKTIQTKNERANLVYAVKVAVKNDGYLKIGLYGGLTL